MCFCRELQAAAPRRQSAVSRRHRRSAALVTSRFRPPPEPHVGKEIKSITLYCVRLIYEQICSPFRLIKPCVGAAQADRTRRESLLWWTRQGGAAQRSAAQRSEAGEKKATRLRRRTLPTRTRARSPSGTGRIQTRSIASVHAQFATARAESLQTKYVIVAP
eukprot:336905-Pleurochrysis_carterae.AAC.1